MKKLTTIFLIFLCIFFSSFRSIPVSAVNTFKEGIYKAADFNLSTGNLYSAQNVSEKGDIYLQLFDENQIIIQSLRLPPKSQKFNLFALKPDYRIVLVGMGEVYIS